MSAFGRPCRGRRAALEVTASPPWEPGGPCLHRYAIYDMCLSITPGMGRKGAAKGRISDTFAGSRAVFGAPSVTPGAVLRHGPAFLLTTLRKGARSPAQWRTAMHKRHCPPPSALTGACDSPLVCISAARQVLVRRRGETTCGRGLGSGQRLTGTLVAPARPATRATTARTQH